MQDKPRVRYAVQMVRKAIGRGGLVRGPCEVCGTTIGVHGHHDDYQDPLVVRWLCSSCHRLHHMKYGHGDNDCIQPLLAAHTEPLEFDVVSPSELCHGDQYIMCRMHCKLRASECVRRMAHRPDSGQPIGFTFSRSVRCSVGARPECQRCGTGLAVAAMLARAGAPC